MLTLRISFPEFFLFKFYLVLSFKLYPYCNANVENITYSCNQGNDDFTVCIQFVNDTMSVTVATLLKKYLTRAASYVQ